MIGAIALTVAVVFLMLTPFQAAAGLISFVVLLFLRPSDSIPALASVPFVKIALATTALCYWWQFGNRKQRFVEYPQARAMLCLFGALAISAPFSYWRTASFFAALDYLKIVLVCFLIINMLTQIRELDRFIGWLIACGCVLALFAARSYFAGDFGLHGVRIKGLVEGAFGDPNDLALCLVMLVPMAWALMVTETRWTYKTLSAGSVLILLMGILATQSRGALLGLGAVLFMVFLRSSRKTVTALVVVAALSVVAAAAPSGSFERFKSIKDYRQDESAMGRLNAWKAGLRMFRDRPAFGVGAGVFEVAYGTRYKPAGTPAKWMAPHSSYVQVLAEAGLIGLICFLMLIYFTFAEVWRARRLVGKAQRMAVQKWRDIRKKLGDEAPPRPCVVPPRLLVLSRAMEASLFGFAVCGAFLTQAYAWVPNIIIALSIALNALIRQNVRAATCSLTKPS